MDQLLRSDGLLPKRHAPVEGRTRRRMVWLGNEIREPAGARWSSREGAVSMEVIRPHPEHRRHVLPRAGEQFDERDSGARPLHLGVGRGDRQADQGKSRQGGKEHQHGGHIRARGRYIRAAPSRDHCLSTGTKQPEAKGERRLFLRETAQPHPASAQENGPIQLLDNVLRHATAAQALNHQFDERIFRKTIS